MAEQLQLFDLAGRRVLVVGLGESGLAMARWASFKGALVSVADTRDAPPQLEALRRDVPAARFASGAFDETLLADADLLAWSPGLSIESGASAEFHRAALARGLPVVGEIELFAQALAVLREQGYRPKLAAITGTNGKTTTTRLVGHLCEHAGLRVAVAGNIAPAALDALRASLVECGERPDPAGLPQVWVLELSSFQLALSHSLAPDAAAILNLTQDHLDWHASMASYTAAKQRIYRGAGGVAGEIGHVTIDVHGHQCICGNRGCLTTYVGSRELVKRAQELAPEYSSSDFAAGEITTASLESAAKAGDPLASRVVHEAAEHIGAVIAGMLNLLNPAAVILGGGLPQLREQVLVPIRETVLRRTFVSAVASSEIHVSTLGDRAIAIGAATLVLDAVLQDPKSLLPTKAPSP